MTRDEMRFNAALAIYRDITKSLFENDMARAKSMEISNVAEFACAKAVEQANNLIDGLLPAEPTPAKLKALYKPLVDEV